MIISKKFSFDAAHFLPYYEGKCRNPHGHRWTVEVACSGEMNWATGMVIDFKELKLLCDNIEGQFDHTSLNEDFDNPTAENIVLYIWNQFDKWCKGKNVVSEYVRVWESPDSMVELANTRR